MRHSTSHLKSLIAASSCLLLFALPAAAAKSMADIKAAAERLPKVSSGSAIVISVPMGQILFEKDADEIRPIASLSKLMSAIVYMDHCSELDLDGLHTMTTANRDLAKGGDKTHLVTGWSYTRRDLLKAALMRSDNRALPALMESCGMILQEYVLLMNHKAQVLGLKHTNFVEPTGLSAYNTSTAREYSRVMIEATRYPVLVEIMRTKDDVIIGYKDGKTRKFEARNTNYLLGRRGVEVIGAKTGYTDIARYCFAILNKLVDNSAVTMIFLGAEGKHTRFGDFSRLSKWLNDKVAKIVAHEPDITVPSSRTPEQFGRHPGAAVKDFHAK